MSQLFGVGTIKANIEVLPGFDSSKIEVVKKLYQDWQNGLLDDESKYEQTFNQLFFGDLLGYEDRVNRIPKGGVMGSGIADLTLGNFVDGKYDENEVQIVCELKGAKTNLTKKQFGHGGLSPIGQGFAYKTGLKNCKWLIVSNFFEIRLYRDNTTDFEVWNLEELLEQNEAKEYFNLKKLYLLLNKNNLLASSGLSKTEHLLSHFREDQKEITKKFYKQYKGLRIDLINDIRHNNPEVKVDVVIEKAQKIIDRLIFIFFCEDKGLLPDKKLKENIVRAREAGFSSWEVLLKFFSLVDRGSKTLEIPEGYNGGLFRDDEVFNDLRVSDAVCKKFTDLTDYDFDDELSVNVLGQIFEQSITDLENLRVDLLGTEVETDQLVDTGKGRRKKDGIFYTPEYIVDYIVQNSVMKYLNEKEDQCVQKYKKDEVKAYQTYQQILQNIKVLDPACGSGAFLVRVFDVLLEENERVGSVLESLGVKSLFNDTTLYKNILTNNIYGVDLNEESVEITKLSLWLKSAQKNKKLNNLDANIKCGNSLIDDPEIAGDKAFDWNKEFKEIMDEGGFDVIVGNPPYVNIINIPKTDLNFLSKKYISAKYGRYDLYVIFIEKAFSLLKLGGVLSFIVPDKICSQKYATSLRKLLLENGYIREIFDCSTIKIFEQAVVDNVILFVENKQNEGKTLLKQSRKTFFETIESTVNQKIFLKIDNYMLRVGISAKNFELINKIEANTLLLTDICYVSFGMQPGNLGKFVFNKIETPEKLEYNKNTQKNFVRGRNLERYYLNYTHDVLFYLPNELHRPAFPELFENKKIMISEISKDIKAVIDTNSFYGNEKTVQVLQWKYLENIDQQILKGRGIELSDKKLKNSKKFKLETILCVLNSKVIDFYFKNMISDGLNVYPDNIRKLPIKEISLSEQQPFIEKADKMLSLNKELHSLLGIFFKRVQDNIHITKLTKKLESFYEGDFKAFIAELKKQKVMLSLKDQDEREPYFNEYKEKIQGLKSEIEKTDTQIDNMVFDLYRLNEEERKIVLNG